MSDFRGIPPLARDYLHYIRTIKGNSPKTAQEYYLNLKDLFSFLISFKKVSVLPDELDFTFISQITTTDLYEYLYYLDSEKNNNANTRARKISCIRGFFKYLCGNQKLLSENPAQNLDSPKLKKALPKYLNLEQSKQLLNAVDGDYKERDYAILLLFLTCGMRLSELVNINLTDIQDDTIIITGKGNKERMVYLSKECQNAIAAYLKVRPRDQVKDRNALFLSKRLQRISDKTVQHLVKKYLEKAGLDTNKYSVHKLRHTAATLMYQHGHVDLRLLQEILGHSQLSTTEIYTHVDNPQLKEATNQNPLANFKRSES